MKKDFICIHCPMGCRLQVGLEQDEVKSVEGQACNRGVEYARQEATHPVRTVTALMRLADRSQPLSVKTSGPVPKDLVFACVKAIYKTHPKAPIRCGEALIENICGTGVSVISTRDVP
jgi:Uncharacterized protein with conserved CXXC pairs